MYQRFIRSCRGRPFTAAGLALLLACGVPVAQAAGAEPTAGAEPIAAVRQSFTIPAGSLEQALNTLGQQAGIVLAFSTDLVSGKQSAGLQGDYTVEQALQQLLAGTGLVASQNQGGYVVAAGSPPGARATLEPVNVVAYVTQDTSTGSKIDLPIREIPQSVSVVTADQIASQSAQSLDQTLLYTAGVVSVTGGATRTTEEVFSLRGFDDRTNSTLYVDGNKRTRNIFSGTTEPYALERIEVLKGPASALYGRAAPGGIINLVTKKPTTEPLRELQFQLGTQDRAQIAGDFGGALDDDAQWSYRLTGLYREAETDVDHIDDNREFLAPVLRWQPSDATHLTVRMDYQKNDTTYNYGLPFEGTVKPNPNGDIAPERFIGQPDFDRWESENRSVGYQFEHAFNDTVTFRQNTHAFESEVDYNYTGFGMFIPGVGSFLWTDDTLTSVHRNFVMRKDEDSGFSVDTQLQFSAHSTHLDNQLLVGVDFVKGDFERNQTRGILGSDPFGPSNTLDLFHPNYPPTFIDPAMTLRTIEGSDLEQTGLYLQNHLKIDGRWTLSAGARRDDVTTNTDYAEPDAPYHEAFEEDSDATTYNAGLVYLADHGLSPYISYSQSFEPNVGLDANGDLFDPSKGDQVEVGIKYRPEGGTLQASLAVFDIRQRDLVVNSFAGYAFGEQIDMRSEGVELETQANLSDGLNLVFAYAYVDAVVTDSSVDDTAFARYQAGNRTAGQPRNTASVWVDYRLPQLNALMLGAGARYHDDTTDFTNEVTVPSYSLVDLAASYDLENWRLLLNVKNVADKEYVAACTYACWYGEGRTATLTASLFW